LVHCQARWVLECRGSILRRWQQQRLSCLLAFGLAGSSSSSSNAGGSSSSAGMLTGMMQKVAAVMMMQEWIQQ
jgi:hypothetical protein